MRRLFIQIIKDCGGWFSRLMARIDAALMTAWLITAVSRHCLSVALAVLLLISNAVQAQASFNEPRLTQPGLLRSRDLTPFQFLRLDMRPAHAITGHAGQWAFGLDLAYQNTWAVGGAARAYIEAMSGRRELTRQDWEAIRQQGEAYLVDLELGQLDFTTHYWLSENLSAYAIVSAASYGGGFLDSTIERFHQTFDLGDQGRPAVTRNRFHALLHLKGTEFAAFGSPVSGGLLDPTLGLRYSVNRVPQPWNLIVELAAKVPYDGQRLLLSTGAVDIGVQATAIYARLGHAAYLSSSAVRQSNGDSITSASRQVIPTLVAGYEINLTERVSSILQGYFSRTAFTNNDTQLVELRRHKVQASLGFRYRTARAVWTAAFTENLQNFSNTPDVGFQFGVLWTPGS